MNKNITHIPEIWSLLSIIEKETELVPYYQQDIGIVYEIPDTNIKLSEEKCKIYQERGFFEVKRLISFPTCPRCGSLHLQIQIRCPNCNLPSLKKSELCIHYECGYIGSIEEFKVVNNIFICAKCGKEMKRIGIDYGRPGIGFICTNCTQIFQYPLVLFVCEKDHQFKIDEVNLTSFPVYKIGKELIKMSKIIEHINSLHKDLEKYGIKSEIFGKIKGMSSVYHVVPLLIHDERMFAIDFMLDDVDLESRILQIIVRSIDIDAITILIVNSNIESKLLKVINPEKIKILPITNEYEIKDTIINKVLNIVTTA